MKLKKKFQISIVFSVLFLVLGGILNLFFYLRVNHLVQEQVLQDYLINRNMNECEKLISEIHTNILTAVISNEYKREQIVRDLDKQAINFDNSLNRLRKLSESVLPFEKARKDFQNFYLYCKQIMSLPNLSSLDEDSPVLDKFRELKNLQINGLRDSFNKYHNHFESSMEQTSQTLRVLTILLILNTFLGIVFAIVIQIFLLGSVIRPVTKLFHAVKAINSGDLDFQAEINTSDEIGELAQNFNHMTTQLHESFLQITAQNERIVNTNQILEQEIEEKELVYKELEHIRNYLNNIIESMPSAIITIDGDKRIVLLNNAANELIGLPQTNMIGSNLQDITDLFNPYLNNLTDILRLRKPAFYTKQYLNNSDKALKNINIYPLIANGVEGFVIRTDDISEMEKIEEQLRQIQKMETVGSLAGGLAHDFNNVLGGIIGFVSLLKYRAERNDIKDMNYLIGSLSEIEKLCNRAHQMINQLLTLSRKHEFVFVPVDLKNSVLNVLKICQNTFDKVVTIKHQMVPEKAVIKGDPNQIEQIVLNLCINAYHAMTIMRKENAIQGGELTIQIDSLKADYLFCNSHPEAKEIMYWRLSVSDNGVGMSKNIISKVFEPFFTTKSKEKGTGLGLSMVYSIVQQHEGFIDVYSEVGVGTSVNVYFPVLTESHEDLKVISETIYYGQGQILIIDDEEMIRQTAQSMLEVCGYTVHCVSDGLKGISFYRENKEKIDLVILDLIMPEKSGDQVYLALKEINPQIKVILASGFRQDHRVVNSLAAGVMAFLQKPYSLEAISKVVHQVLTSVKNY